MEETEGAREGQRKPKTGRQRGIKSEKEGGGKEKRHKAQNRDNVTNEIQFCCSSDRLQQETGAGTEGCRHGAWGVVPEI